MHFHGNKDPLFERCLKNPLLYADSEKNMKVIIEHDEGHKVLKKFNTE